jgi:hypothetical protein
MTSRLWYRAVLREDRDEQISMIREQFAAALNDAGWPEGACLFLTSRHARGETVSKDDSPADAEAVFFSPAAISAVPHLIVACGAEPSPPPDRTCATLLVGELTAWDLLPRSTH